MRAIIRRILRWEPGISLWQWAWDRVVGNWQGILYLFGGGGFLGWAAANFDLIAQHGWGAIVFAAVGIICAAAITVSVGLIGWRYFRPLPQIALAPSDPLSEPTVIRAVLPPAIAHDKEAQVDRDVLLLLNFSVDHTTACFLQELIDAAPNCAATVLQSSPEHHAAEQQFVSRVASETRGTHRGMIVRSILVDMENEAEQEIHRLSIAGWPDGFNPLDLRNWEISRRQTTRLVAFLAAQKHEVEGRIVSQRSGLIERLSLRNPP